MTRCYRYLSFAALFLVAASLSATTLRRLSLDQVRDRAESIFIGHVVSSSVRAVANGELQATDYTVAVTETLYGTVTQTTTVTYIGGPARAIEGVPRIEIGHDYVFFRTAQPNNTTVGWSQGLFRIENANIDGLDRKVLISGDDESLMMIDGTLSRGRRVALTAGKIVPVAAAPAEIVQHAVTGIATNADGTPAKPARPVVRSAAPATATFATLDDLRRFVRARGANSR